MSLARWGLLGPAVGAAAVSVSSQAGPSDQVVASFRSVEVSDTGAVFTNPAQDFPQRIAYIRRGTDSLLAAVSGSSRGMERRIEFRYRRVACP